MEAALRCNFTNIFFRLSLDFQFEREKKNFYATHIANYHNYSSEYISYCDDRCKLKSQGASNLHLVTYTTFLENLL